MENSLQQNGIISGSLNGIVGRPKNLPEGVVRIVVGPKPQFHATWMKTKEEWERDLPKRLQKYKEALERERLDAVDQTDGDESD